MHKYRPGVMATGTDKNRPLVLLPTPNLPTTEQCTSSHRPFDRERRL